MRKTSTGSSITQLQKSRKKWRKKNYISTISLKRTNLLIPGETFQLSGEKISVPNIHSREYIHDSSFITQRIYNKKNYNFYLHTIVTSTLYVGH